MKPIQYTSLFLLAIVALTACSRKKDTFLNKKFHAVSTEYNTLFNGNNAFVQGKEAIAQTYRDDFYQILPVERIEVVDLDGFDTDSKDPNFNKAEEKAVKAIQKHSMYIGGKEYNPQIDEAYMLLGKARYYDNRFIPALDAFNFILNKSATSNNVNNAKIWKAKTNIRLNNEDYAIENLQKMLREENLEDAVVADANAMIAQAMINLDSIPQALPYMKIANELEDNYELKGRFSFIIGQLYNKLNYKDSANIAFDQVIGFNRKTARVYMINAHMAKTKNFNYTQEDRTMLLALLHDLEQDRENRPFLDKIYNALADYHRNTTSDSLAIVYYNKSIQSFKEDQTLLATKVNQALAHGLTPIFCCGESLEIRESGTHEETVKAQLTASLFHLSPEEFSKVVIAYEPIWAIGTGKTASAEQAQEMHAALRSHLASKYGQAIAEQTSILYGGSANPGNAKELFGKPDVDGGLIGGASLKSRDFIEIIKSF